jgi:hypothetical protein
MKGEVPASQFLHPYSGNSGDEFLEPGAKPLTIESVRCILVRSSLVRNWSGSPGNQNLDFARMPRPTARRDKVRKGEALTSRNYCSMMDWMESFLKSNS